MSKLIKYYFSTIQKCKEFVSNKENGTKILMFHQTSDKFKMSESVANFYIEKKNFFKLINFIENNKSIVSVGEKVESNKNTYAITFDDAYADVYNNAYPILKEKNIPFTVFMTCNFINKKGYLTKEMLMELSNEPLCTIGSHTITHPLLRFCDDKQAEREIIESKVILEEITGNAVNCFAYPYGSIYACSKRDILLAKNAGYRIAFSTLNTPATELSLKNPFLVPRININDSNWRATIGYKENNFEI